MAANKSLNINAGLIGCGRIATAVHLPAMMKIEGLKVKAASDINEKNLRETVEKFHIDEEYLNYREMLRDADIDAVWICTPPETHQEIVLDCLRMDKHTLCEKPLSTSLEGALQVKSVIEEINRDSVRLILMPAHNFLFTPNLEYAVKLVNEGVIGEVKRVKGSAYSNLIFYGAKTDFRLRADGGVIEDQLPHVIYVCQSIAGGIKSILSVNASRSGHAYINSVQTTALTEKGVRVEMNAEWSSLIPKFEAEIFGTTGTIQLDTLKAPYKVKIIKNRESETVNLGKKYFQFLDTLRNRHPSYLREDLHFCRCIKGVEEPRISVDDGVEVTRVLGEVMSFLKEEKKPLKRELVALQPVEDCVETSLQNLLRMVNVKKLMKSSLVLIKPNICYPKNPHRMVITDPELLRCVINFVKDRVKNVLVVESDNNSGRAETRAEKSGIMKVVEECEAEFVNLSDVESDEFEVQGHRLLIPKILREADFIINVPKMKTCNIEGTTITIAMKNMFGILSNRKKSKLHKKLLEILLYINKKVKQDLIIVDGIIAMEGLGPVWGSPVKMNLLVAGTNPVAVDSICGNIMGINPYSIELLWRAYQDGMGEINIENIKVVGAKPEELKRNFEIPVLTPKNLLKALKARFTR